MKWTQGMHLRGLLRILWIMIIHIYNSHCLGNLISSYHAMDKEPSLDTTEFIFSTMDAIITDNELMTDEKQENSKNDILTYCQHNIDMNDNGHIWRNNDANSNHSNTRSPITPNYDIEILEESRYPILSYINHTTTYQEVFNPSWIPLSDTVSQTGIVVQVQNCSLIPGECEYCNSTTGIVFTPCNAATGICEHVAAPSGRVPSVLQSNQSTETIIDSFISKQTHFWQNPSIFYWQNVYYMFVNEPKSSDPNSNEPNEYVALYTADDPTNISNTYTPWIYVQNAFTKKDKITGPASLLPMNLSEPNAKHYLFFGGEGYISVTNSCHIQQWDNIDFNPWLSPRTNYFDKDGVETGPAPIKLHDGNYLMLYNGYTISEISGHDLVVNVTKNHAVIPHKIKHYEIGWVILDGKNPTKILQRSDKPLLTATFDYEIGNKPYTCTQHSSVYAKGIIKLEGPSNSTTESFRVYFSAADTSVGTAIISVSYASSDDTTKEWFEAAVLVSIGSAIFVLAMFVVIWCKNQDSSSVLDLTTEPEFISIASAHQSSFKDISGTNHNGTPYVIGSLDRKVAVHSSDHIPRKKRRKHRSKYETNNGHNHNHDDNPNHIHVHTTECYEEHSNENCRYLHQDENAQNGLNTSLQSNISSSSCSSNSSSSSSSSSTSTATGNSPTSSSTSYCSHCHGKFHETRQEKEISKSETMRLSQISFRINETLEKDSHSPSSTNNYANHMITIDGYNPNITKFSFTNKSLGQRLIQKN